MNETISQIWNNIIHTHTRPIRDPLWKHIYLSPAHIKLTQTAPFQRLNRMRQLGSLYWTYPGAVHTRYNHSIGVFHIAKQMIGGIIAKDPDNNAGFTKDGIEAFLCAALLHDLGHFPFAHNFYEFGLTEHETLSARYIIENEIAHIIKNDIGIDPHIVATIIDPNIPSDNNALSEDYTLYQNMLSGPIDPDKLDYLNRDAYFCGVPYGYQDIDFIIQHIRVHEKNLELSAYGAVAIEHLFFSKYMMYRSIYWHTNQNISAAMIKKAIHSGLNDKNFREFFNLEELYALDDESFFSHFRKTSATAYPYLQLITDVYNRNLFRSIYEYPLKNKPIDTLHEFLQIDHRTKKEAIIIDTLKKEYHIDIQAWEIIIDLPDKISFEVNMSIYSEQNSLKKYPDNKPESTVELYHTDNQHGIFTDVSIREQFIQSLRNLRIYVHPKIEEKLKEKNILNSQAFKDRIQSIILNEVELPFNH